YRAPGLARQHRRRRVLDSKKNAFDVHRQDLIDGRHVDLSDADHRRRNSGIVHEAIETTEPFERSIDHRLDVGLVGHVRADETNADLLLERTALLLAAPDNHDLSPFRDKALGYPFADAARAAGHDYDLPVQRAHVSLPVKCPRAPSRVLLRR